MQGYDVEIASDAVWSAKTTAQFSTYQAIVFGDGRFTDATASGTTPPSDRRLKFCKPLVTADRNIPLGPARLHLVFRASQTTSHRYACRIRRGREYAGGMGPSSDRCDAATFATRLLTCHISLVRGGPNSRSCFTRDHICRPWHASDTS